MFLLNIVHNLAEAQVMAADSGGGAGVGILVLIYLAGVIGAIVFMVQNRQSFQVEVPTSLSQEDAVDFAIRQYTMNGWTTTSNTRGNVTLALQHRPSCLIAIFLFLLGFIPGIIYLAIGGKALATNLQISGNGSTGSVVRVNCTSKGFGGKATADRLVSALPH